MSQSLIIRKSSGTSLTIIRTGANSGGTAYVLPPANATTLGGVKVGSGLTVLANGLIEVSTSYLRDDAANGTLTITGDSGSTTSDLISEVTGSHQQSTVNNAGSYGFSNWYLRTSTASQVVVWGGYGIDTTSQSLSIGYNYAAQFAAGVSYGRSLKISGSDITLEQQALGGATLPAKVWSANSVLTKGYADGQYLPYANFTYANLPGTPNLSVYLLSSTANATFQPLGNYLAVSCLTFSNLTGKPTTLAGYGITDAYPLTGNPAGYLVPSNLTGYLTSSTAASTYAILSRSITTGTGLTGGGDLSANRTLSLATSGVTAGTYGSQSASPVITVDTYGRITSASSNPIIIDWSMVSGRPDTATLVTLTGTQTLTNKTLGSTIVSGTLAFNGQLATQVKLQSPSETFTSPTIATGTLTLDLASSTFFKVSLNAAITTLTISNAPASAAAAFTLEFTADGTARAVTWPASVKWPAGTAPTLTSTSGKTDTFVFYTTDSGATWRAFVTGQNS